MSNTSEIINEISNYLDKYSLKTSSLTNSDLISYIEDKWKQADDEKYTIHYGRIIMGRMTNEYISLKDFANMMRWLEMSNRHKSSKEHPDYIINYFNGQCCLECGHENKALEYFNLSYNENPDYIFSRAPFCYEFFNKNLENPRVLEPLEEEIEEEYYIELTHWQKFFKENGKLCVTFLDTNREGFYEISKEQEKTISYLKENQQLILKNILVELLKGYPSLQKIYSYSKEEKNDFMPDLNQIDGFSDLLSPTSIYVLENEESEPNIGFLFGCSWDTEHGLGVMTYKSNVEEIGGADTAFC